MAKEDKYITLKRFFKLLTPSAMSSVICVVLSLVICLSAIFLNRYKSSSLKLNFLYDQVHHSLGSSYLTGSLLNNTIVNDLPLLIFWAIIGIVVYLIAADIVKTISSAVEIREELGYVHADRGKLLRPIMEKLFIRLAVIAIWIPYILIFFNNIMPYALRSAITSTTAGDALLVPAYVVLSVVVSSAALHVNTVLLRLLFFKPRLFTSIN